MQENRRTFTRPVFLPHNMNTIKRFLALTGVVAVCHAGAEEKLTDPALANKLGITVQQLHSLRATFNLSDQQLSSLPHVQLQEILWDLGHPGVDKHAEEQRFRGLLMMDEHGHIPPDGLMKAIQQRHEVPTSPDLFPSAGDPSTNTPPVGSPTPLLAGIQTNGWTWLGPGNIGGRVRSILIHPTITNIMWCGGVDGGVWKSTNSGASWFPLNDFMANLAVASMAMDPSNANVLYAGTGEGFFNGDSVRGAGIFKSIDGGTTWFQLASTATSSFNYVNRIALDPNNGQNLLAATRTGVYLSSNGGTNWSFILGTEMLDVAFHPSDSTMAIAAGWNGNAFYSTNGGHAWIAATGLPIPGGFAIGRVEIAYSRSSPNIVYASVDNNQGEVYVSMDGGQTYGLVNTGNNYLSSQGWYDNAVWVDPTNPNVVIVAGTDVWESMDGGSTFTDIGGYSGSIHPDQHTIVSSPAYDGSSVRTLYVGNDGGMFCAFDAYNVSSTNGWETLNNNLGITQFYGAAGNTNTSVIVGGTQDNGTLRYSPTGGPEDWTQMFGGDGGFAAADQTDPNYFYGEYVYLQIHRSTDSGLSSDYIYSGITEAGNSGPNFISPFVLDPNNPNVMLGGGTQLWQSTNVKAVAPSWTSIKPSVGSPISAIAVAPGNSSIIWVGHNSGAVYYTVNGTSGSPTWIQANLGTPNLPARYCSRIAICPTNANKVYVTFGGFNSGNVWRTTDSGVTWSNISANLPAAPINSIVIAPADPNTIYVGGVVGVFGSSNDGASWSTGNDGPANAEVDELFWLGRSLVAATHGRGVFSITPALGPATLAAAGDVLVDGNGNGHVDPNECSQLFLAVEEVGGTNATNVSAVLTTSSPGVTILQGSSTYPNLGSAALATNLSPFEIYTSPSFVCGTAVLLNLTVTFNGVTNVLSYSLPTGSSTYTVNQSTGMSIVPGTADSGNHGDEVTTPLSLPFPFVFYGQTFSTVFLNSNGYLELLDNNSYYANVCLPYSLFNYAICPFWTDLRTDNAGEGIFTSISGTAPNRIFNIEWRAEYFGSGKSANFEVRLYENQSRIDMVYGNLNGNGNNATVGIQSDIGSAWTTFECNAGGLSAGLQVTFAPTCADGGGPCAPLAQFTAGPTNGPAPLTVNFTNLSSGSASYSWNFGDSTSSTNANPSHTYTNAGFFTVSLQAISASATNTITQTNYLTVTTSTVPPPTIVSVGESGTNFVFSFNTVSGHTYTVQYKNLLTDSVWQTLQSFPGSGGIINFSTTNGLVGVPQRFFRLDVQ